MSGSVLLAIALGVKLFQTYFTKRTSIALKTEREIVAFTAWRYLLCVLLALLLLLFEGGPSLSPAALGIAALGGVSLALCGVFEYVALRHGAVVLVQLAGMSGMLISGLGLPAGGPCHKRTCYAVPKAIFCLAAGGTRIPVLLLDLCHCLCCSVVHSAFDSPGRDKNQIASRKKHPPCPGDSGSSGIFDQPIGHLGLGGAALCGDISGL